MTDMTRRLTPKRITQDIDAFSGFKIVKNYTTMRQEASPEALQAALDTMRRCQRQEIQLIIKLGLVRDHTREAEWAFHNAVLAMKQSILGQFGPDSNEAQAVGYKKKSARKRSRRKKILPAVNATD